MKFLIVALMVVCSAYAKLECPNYTPQANFDVSKYLGKWFEIQRLPNTFEKFQTCITAQYSENDENSINVVNRGIYDLKVYKFPISATGTATILDKSLPSVLGVTFNAKKPQTTPNYVVLDTDYENYSLVYTCRIEPSLFKSESKVEYGWLLSRQRTMDPAIVEKLKAKLAALGADVNSLVQVDQSNCDE